MFKRTRRRIVLAIMAILALLFAGTLIVIYGVSYQEVDDENRAMLARYIVSQLRDDEERHRAFPDGGPPNDARHGSTRSLDLSTFYSVLFVDGTVADTDNAEGPTYSAETLEHMAREILENGNESGFAGDLLFQVYETGSGTLVAFMDNTVTRENMHTLFRYTLIFGSAAMVGFYFVSVYLARRIVAPLEETYIAQRQFISDAGHELKTPISVVNANAEVLEREIGDNTWLKSIQYENGRMGELVGQLLDLARTEDMKTVREKLDFSRLVSGEALPFESVAFENGMVLNSVIEEGIHVEGNAEQLRRLVAILIDNAVKHGKSGAPITLALNEGAHRQAVLCIENASDPLSADQLAHLFDRFYQADAVRNSEGGHYGLGLAIAKAIAASNGGRIEAGYVGGRAIFTFRMPLDLRP